MSSRDCDPRGGAPVDAAGRPAIARRIDEAYASRSPRPGDGELFEAFRDLLGAGRIRAAEPDPDAPNGWRVNAWVKRGILLGFRLGAPERYEVGGLFHFSDKSTFPPRTSPPGDGTRVVPGGSAIREGAFVGAGVTCMPPMYVNVGAWVGEGTMIDSHALVGSCAQIGARCHVSAAAQIGGVLEPVGALPVVVEDDALIGGGSGVYEGAIVRRGAVLAAGVVLTRTTPLFDAVRGEVLRAQGDGPLVVPANAVVVPGSRPMSSGWGRERGLSLQAPVIVKYRDERTDDRVRLEASLR